MSEPRASDAADRMAAMGAELRGAARGTGPADAGVEQAGEPGLDVESPAVDDAPMGDDAELGDRS